MNSTVKVTEAPFPNADNNILLREDIVPELQLNYAFENGVKNVCIFIEAQSGYIPRNRPKNLRDELTGKLSQSNQISSLKFTRTNKLLIETSSRQCAQEIVGLSTLLEVPIKSYLQTENITSRFALHNIDPSLSLFDLGTELQDVNGFKIKELRRFTKKTPCGVQPTGTVLVTIFGTFIPSEVKFFYMMQRIRPFYDRPRQCSNCWRYDHIASKCKYDLKCMKCSDSHLAVSCPNDLMKCSNCSENHRSSDPSCPFWKREVNILKFKTDNHITISEARRRFRTSESPTFATVTASSASHPVGAPPSSTFDSLLEDFLMKAQEAITKMFQQQLASFQQQLLAIQQQVILATQQQLLASIQLATNVVPGTSQTPSDGNAQVSNSCPQQIDVSLDPSSKKARTEFICKKILAMKPSSSKDSTMRDHT